MKFYDRSAVFTLNRVHRISTCAQRIMGYCNNENRTVNISYQPSNISFIGQHLFLVHSVKTWTSVALNKTIYRRHLHCNKGITITFESYSGIFKTNLYIELKKDHSHLITIFRFDNINKTIKIHTFSINTKHYLMILIFCNS